MNIKYVLFPLTLLLSIQAYGQETFKSIKITPDTVKLDWIKKQINNDSIVFLEYQKIRYNEMPNVVDERVVYLDFRKTDIREKISNVKKQLKNIIDNKSYLKVYKTDKYGNKINPYKEITNIYIPIYKLNDNYIVFLPDFDYPRIISDTAYLYKDDEGLLLYYFQDVNKNQKLYNLSFNDFQNHFSKIIFQFYDKEKKISVWEEVFIGVNNKEFRNYKLYVPLEEAIKYPLLNIVNTGGLDDVYDKFDKLYLEKRFNE